MVPPRIITSRHPRSHPRHHEWLTPHDRELLHVGARLLKRLRAPPPPAAIAAVSEVPESGCHSLPPKDDESPKPPTHRCRYRPWHELMRRSGRRVDRHDPKPADLPAPQNDPLTAGKAPVCLTDEIGPDSPRFTSSTAGDGPPQTPLAAILTVVPRSPPRSPRRAPRIPQPAFERVD